MDANQELVIIIPEVSKEVDMSIGEMYEVIALKYFAKIYDEVGGFVIETIIDFHHALRYFSLAVEHGHEDARDNYELCLAQKEKNKEEVQRLL